MKLVTLTNDPYAALKEECSKTDSFATLLQIALREMNTLASRGDVHVISGPISTGGLGSIEKNIAVFDKTVEHLRSQNYLVFDYGPYESGIAPLRTVWKAENPEAHYCMPILEEFYGPLFETRLIKKAWFIHGWESSFGSTWERKKLSELEIPIEDLPPEWSRDLA
jgi:hypothetical protein